MNKVHSVTVDYDNGKLIVNSSPMAEGANYKIEREQSEIPHEGYLATYITALDLIGYWYGIKTGLTAAIAYGVLQLLLDPYILNIPQVLLDYILGFGALGLSGIFSKSKHGLVKGYIIGVIGRFICSFLSGWIFFAVYTPDFFNSAILYSVVYNGSYIGLEAVVTLVVISLPPVNKALAYVKNNLV